MQLHANAKLGLAGRLALVRAIDEGCSIRAAADRFGVAPATAHRWWCRWRAAEAQERRSLCCLHDHSSRPRCQPHRLSADEEARVVHARARTGLGPGRLAGIVSRPRSTIWKVLHRHGLSRRPRQPRIATRRYEWAQAGALLHVDTARLAAFRRPGHRVRGRSTATRRDKGGWGYVFLHVAIDDRSRYAYVEQHPDERGETCARFLRRACAHFRELGLRPPEAVMTDNAFSYRLSRAFQEELRRIGARHITPPPYTPRWNGKAERFIQTLKREWAEAHEWPSSHLRARALASYLRTYNRRRPHSSLGERPPISRVHNLRGQDT
jgi:transposase InsO family protein